MYSFPKWIVLPGLVDYQDGLDLMEQELSDVINSRSNGAIFLLEHKPVYTAGTSTDASELLDKNKFPVIYTGRGGRLIYHGPGQRVIYPIINLNAQRDLKLYVQNLENWIINTLAQFDVNSYKIEGKIGVWVKNKRNIDAKIAAIGIRVKKYVAYHGIAVNINTDLSHYDGIVPCGISDLPVTSLSDIGVNISMHDFDSALIRSFCI